jgi:hypothetical protein
MRAPLGLLAATVFSASAWAFDPAPYYEYDPTFNQDSSLQDHFPSFSSGTVNSRGYKAARLDNGDTVMVGIVDQIGAADPANNVGLTRYGPDGQNVAWAHPDSSHVDFDPHYLVYPNDATAYYSKIDDVVVLGGNVYVLADCTCGGGDSNVHILGFHDDGSFIGDIPAFHTAGVPEYGAALVPYFYPYFFPPSHSGTAYELVAFATYNNGSRYIVTAGRWNADEVTGELAIDSSGFGPYDNGKNDYLAPDSFCAAAADCTLIASGAAGARTSTSAPTIYVAATTQRQGTDEQIVLLQVDSAGNGQFLQTFGFDEAGGNLADQSVAIAAVTGSSTADDDVYVAANVGRAGGGVGIGVVKFHGGALDTGFAGSGHTLLAGSGGDFDQPFAMTIDQGLLAIAGEHEAAASATVDPLLAVVRAADGALVNLDSYPMLNAVGYRFGTASFTSVFGNGDGRFTAGGYIIGRYTNEANFAVQRFSHDRIFRDRFDGL